eukprot:TRINITY_DN2012_c6_g1_i1.p1 TRINITY_DN2012_c6_g1~~TRINITY_DN2012_c6_g1_i1.p1  ORF type:complete len:1441 (+),score=284.22 TRINITY_DN2012_c6_g1_i1:186-4325(+)
MRRYPHVIQTPPQDEQRQQNHPLHQQHATSTVQNSTHVHSAQTTATGSLYGSAPTQRQKSVPSSVEQPIKSPSAALRRASEALAKARQARSTPLPPAAIPLSSPGGGLPGMKVTSPPIRNHRAISPTRGDTSFDAQRSFTSNHSNGSHGTPQPVVQVLEQPYHSVYSNSTGKSPFMPLASQELVQEPLRATPPPPLRHEPALAQAQQETPRNVVPDELQQQLEEQKRLLQKKEEESQRNKEQIQALQQMLQETPKTTSADEHAEDGEDLEQHKEEMKLAFELHQQQQMKIKELSEQVEQLQAKKEKAEKEKKSDAPLVLGELKRMQEQNSIITERLSRQVELLCSSPPPENLEGTPRSRPRTPRQSPVRERQSRLQSPSVWSPSALKVGAKVDNTMKKPSEFLHLTSDSYGRTSPKKNKRSHSREEKQDKYRYTREALKQRSSSSRKEKLHHRDYAFGSTVKIKIDQGKIRKPVVHKEKVPVTMPPNRHRLGRSRSGSVSRTPRVGPTAVKAMSWETWEEVDDDIVNPGARVATVSVEELQLPLPDCCKSLPLTDGGVSPQNVAQLAHLHLADIVAHYSNWLKISPALELEEAAAFLCCLPLSSLPGNIATTLCSKVLDLLGRADGLSYDVLLFLLRILRLLGTGATHLPQMDEVFDILASLMRNPDLIELTPGVVSTLLAFGPKGLSVILEEASRPPPQPHEDLMREHAVSGWNSMVLTLLINQPAITMNVVLPLILKDLREGTPERAEAACNALTGLYTYNPRVLGQLGDVLTSGRFDRRVVCVAIRMMGGTEGVALLQGLLSHPSHRVRQAAVWGLGLHTPLLDGSIRDFDEAFPEEHQPLPPFERLSVGCTTVVHAELPSLEHFNIHTAVGQPPAVLYFQPQITPNCPPYIETHIIVDACVFIRQCRELVSKGVLDLSVGQQLRPAFLQPSRKSVRELFIQAAKHHTALTPDENRHVTLFLGSFTSVTRGQGVMSLSMKRWKETVRPLSSKRTTLPEVPHRVVSRIVSALSSTIMSDRSSQQDVIVKGEALSVLRWFPPEELELNFKTLKPLMESPHASLRASMVQLLAVLHRSSVRSATVDVNGLLVTRLSDTHPKVRLAAVIAFRCGEVPQGILQTLLTVLRDGKTNRYQVAHTMAGIPKGIEAMIGISKMSAVDDVTRKAALYGLGRVADDVPSMEAVVQCLVEGCQRDKSAELREQALLSLGTVCRVFHAPLMPPAVREQAEGAQPRVLYDHASEMVYHEDSRLRDVAACTLCLCGKKGVSLIQEILLKPRVASYSVKLSAAKALHLIPNKATLYKTALLTTSDPDASIRDLASQALLSVPPKRIVIDLQHLTPSSLAEVKAASQEVIAKSGERLPPQTMHCIKEVVKCLQ